jgi:hypothetical protein
MDSSAGTGFDGVDRSSTGGNIDACCEAWFSEGSLPAALISQSSVPSLVSQIRTVLSFELDASYRLSGENATGFTQLVSSVEDFATCVARFMGG